MTSRLESMSALKERVKELEGQVSEYKLRLVELRHAKNTTILKREREVVQVSAPKLGRREWAGGASNVDLVELQQKISDCEEQRKREVAELMRKNDELLKGTGKCNHMDEIKLLRERFEETSADNAALIVENDELKKRVSSLTSQLDTKEAKWCEAEEKLNMKLKMQWSEKYARWMAETERKLEDLRRSNAFLTSYINDEEKHKDLRRTT